MNSSTTSWYFVHIMSYPLLLFMVILGHFGEWFCFGTKWLVCLVHDHKKSKPALRRGFVDLNEPWQLPPTKWSLRRSASQQTVPHHVPLTAVFLSLEGIRTLPESDGVSKSVWQSKAIPQDEVLTVFFSNSVFLLGFWRVFRFAKKVASRPSDPRCNQGRWSGSQRLKSRALTRGTVHWSGQRNSKSPCCGGLLRARSAERRFQSPLYGSAILLLPDFAMLAI